MSRSDFELLLVSMVWGINAIGVKDALTGFLPMQFNALRLSIAAALLVLAMRTSGSVQWPSREQWPTVVLAGFLGNTVHQYLYIRGISMSSAVNTQFVVATLPVTTAGLSHLMGRQRLTLRMWSGVLMAFAGIVAVSLSSGGSPATQLPGGLLGDVATLTGTIAFSVSTILATDLTRGMSPLVYTTWSMVIGATFLVPLSLTDLMSADWSVITGVNWCELLFSSLVAVAIGYIIWNKAVRESGPARAAVFLNLTPVWTGLFGWALLGEKWNLLRVLGAAVTLAGASLVRIAPEGVDVGNRKARRRPYGGNH